MIRCEIEPNRDRRSKTLNRLQLEGTDLNREHIKLRLIAHDPSEGLSNIAAGNCSLAACVQHLRDQFCGRRFAVSSSDRDDRPLAKSPAEFEFTDHFGFLRREILREAGVGIDAGAYKYEIVGLTTLTSRC